MQYSIATNWDDRLTSRFKKLNLLYKDKIIELFNSLSFGCAVPAPKIKLLEIEEKIKLIKKEGFGFNYLINSSIWPSLRRKEIFRKTKEYLLWLESQKVDIITVANENLLSFIYEYFPKLKVNISIVDRKSVV